MMFVFVNLLCVALLVGVDQFLKHWAVRVLQPVGAMPFIPHVLELRFVVNRGMAFSLLSGKQTFLIIVTGAALGFVGYLLFKKCRPKEKRPERIALILVLSGGLGNLIDRFFNGEVVDYLNPLFMRFAVFNFADICVCVGVGLWILEMILEEVKGDSDKGKTGERS